MQSSAKSSSTVTIARPDLIQNQWEEFVEQLLSGILIDGKYRILRQISSGGMGAVFEAINEFSGGRVVIKVPFFDLAPNQTSSGSNPINERIKQEVQAAIRAGAQHPGIVRMMDCIQLSGNTPAIVMEFLEGDLLSERLKGCDGCMDLATVLRLGRQMASALAAVHAASVIHRDLKPSNVMIVRDPDVTGGERAKVFDFGIAKVATPSSTEKRLTQVGWFMGTRFYSAPEQQSDSASVDSKADVYSLGIVLYEMLGGTLPLQHPLQTKCSAPPWLIQLIAKMTAASATIRPTMEQVAATLEPPQLSRLRPEIGWSLFAALVLVLGVTGFLSAFPHRTQIPITDEAKLVKVGSSIEPSIKNTNPIVKPAQPVFTAPAQPASTAPGLEGPKAAEIARTQTEPVQSPEMSPSQHGNGATVGPTHSEAPLVQPDPTTSGLTHQNPCPWVSPRCLSIVSASRTERLSSLIRQALTQDVRVRLCPDQKFTLSRTSAGVLEIDAAREITPRNRTIINLSLQTLIHSDEHLVPPKVIIRCKPR